MKTPRSALPEMGTKSTRPTRPPAKAMPQPSARFRRAQRELCNLIAKGHTIYQSGAQEAYRQTQRRRGEIEAALRDEFKSAFGLNKDAYQRARRLFWKLTGGNYYPLFDHVSYYQRGSNLFIVSQPYGIDEDKLRCWRDQTGALAHGVIPEWAHYYPGQATCCYVEFAPPSQKQRRARRSW